MNDVASLADEATRVRLCSGADTPADVLQDMAGDPSVTVRAALALNPMTPPPANRALLHDRDERVRILLARKLAALLPGLSRAAQTRLQRETHDTLTALVMDEALRVRAAIADVVKDMPEAPRHLILALAHDAAIMVSEPVIRFSPLLGTDDLLSLLAKTPSPAMLRAVAGRTAIDHQVSDVIAAAADGEAIRALLRNHSAQIREATLDALIARAVDHVDWHEPLITRPVLSPRAARALSAIVATHLLEVLVARADLDPALAEELRARLELRLAVPAEQRPRPLERTPEQAMIAARDLESAGLLTEHSVLEAARQGEMRLAAALLSVAAGMPITVVDRATTLRSAKGFVSLAWKAGFSMRAAAALQALLARRPPDTILHAGPGGGFPLDVEEMRWQLEFLGRARR